MKEQKNQDLPYERFLQLGPESLTESELLAIILRTGTREKSALQIASEVLGRTKYPRRGLLGLYDMSLEELTKIKGIGQVKAIKLKCLTELSMRFARATAQKGLNVKQPATVAEFYMEKLRHLTTECVYVVCLDGKGQLIAEKKISEGCVNKSLITPREVFLAALGAKAVSIILIHNHPSGNPHPSGDDREITERIRKNGEELGIPLLDHIIIGDNTFFSFCNERLI